MGENTANSDDRVLLDTARWRLSILWFIWAFVIFAVVVLQSIFGRYGEQVQEAWSWFIPTVVPTLSLMIGVIGEAAMQNQKDVRSVKRNFFKLAFWISAGYLLILSLTILLQPFAPVGAIELYVRSNYWLAPMQGIVAGALGLLFTSQQRGVGSKTTKLAT
jgi:hypothetical protein